MVHFLTFAHVWMWAYNYIKIITDILEAEWSNGKSAQVIVRHTGSEPHSPLHFIKLSKIRTHVLQSPQNVINHSTTANNFDYVEAGHIYILI